MDMANRKKILTCINCPVGCRMEVTLSTDGGFLSVSGNTCPRGAAYAQQECTRPLRTVTAVLPVIGSSVPLSVKTSAPIPKEKIGELMAALADIRVSAPVALGDIIIPDVLHTGADLVATRSI